MQKKICWIACMVPFALLACKNETSGSSTKVRTADSQPPGEHIMYCTLDTPNDYYYAAFYAVTEASPPHMVIETNHFQGQTGQSTAWLPIGTNVTATGSMTKTAALLSIPSSSSETISSENNITFEYSGEVSSVDVVLALQGTSDLTRQMGQGKGTFKDAAGAAIGGLMDCRYNGDWESTATNSSQTPEVPADTEATPDAFDTSANIPPVATPAFDSSGDNPGVNELPMFEPMSNKF